MCMIALRLAAVVLTALCLVPSGAHLFALPNKIGLPQEAYFTVQAIYRGWSWFGLALGAALAANLGLTLAERRHAAAFRLTLTAFVLIAATLAIFFIWTYPANQATANWMVAPANWQMLRAAWEYAHAANAVLTFGALVSVTLSTLIGRLR